MEWSHEIGPHLEWSHATHQHKNNENSFLKIIEIYSKPVVEYYLHENILSCRQMYVLLVFKMFFMITLIQGWRQELSDGG